MSAITGAAVRVGRAGRGLLPSGQLLTPEVWERRHRGIVWLLWLHVAGVAAFAVVRGPGLAHGLLEASPLAAFALAAAHPALGRRVRSAAAVLGLITASAVIVHLSGGVVEAHFHFFVMVGVITLYCRSNAALTSTDAGRGERPDEITGTIWRLRCPSRWLHTRGADTGR